MVGVCQDLKYCLGWCWQLVTVTIHKSQDLTLPKIKLGLGKWEFLTGLTFVALSCVKALDDLIVLGEVDYSRVQKLGGKHLQYHLDDYVCRHNLALI